MYKIKTYDNIAEAGLNQFPVDHYQLSDAEPSPDAILLRSFSLHNERLPKQVLAIARAGAGVNNIPINKCSALGIPVFNTPGANANAVKELTIAAILMHSRNLLTAHNIVKQLAQTSEELPARIEKLKKQFVGQELPGKTLAVIGLGAIGGLVANAAEALGMRVIGFDPNLSVDNAWCLSGKIKHETSIQRAIEGADFVSLHIPLLDATRGLFNEELLGCLKKECVLLNFARDAIIEEQALYKALDTHSIGHYVTDFPTHKLLSTDHATCFPHLGASTHEAEDSCAIQAARDLIAYIETGQIGFSVNFPSIMLALDSNQTRTAIIHRNIPNMIGKISAAFAGMHINIADLHSRSRDDLAYTLIDTDEPVPSDLTETLSNTDDVVRIRMIGTNKQDR